MNERRLFGPGAELADQAFSPVGLALPRTALRVLRGAPLHFEEHLQRLESGALAMGQPVDWLPSIRTEIEMWLRDILAEGDAALRLVLHPETRLVTALLEPLPSAPQPYRLVVLPHPLGSRQEDPRVIHKGLAGPWNLDILAKARQLGADDALLIWPDETLAETAIASLGIEIDGVLKVPPPEGRVGSLAERLGLPEWAAARHLRIAMTPISVAEARDGQVWCMNALRGIWSATLL
jgi:branched-subunit amino acid aminotransferase/4-amino-4-deoxychorismate lyase